MKLVIATASAALLGIVAAGSQVAMAQTAGAEDAAAPDLRGDDESDSAPEASDAGAAASGTAPDATAASTAPIDPAVQLADAKAAALAAAATSGAAADPLVSNVADYALFQRDLAAIEEREIAEPEDLDAVMDTLAGYDPATLNDAFLSYGAFVGAQQTEFVDRVKEVAEYYGVDQLVQGMLNEPEYVLTFPGARAAAAVVLGVVREDVEALTRMSDRFKQESYDLQNRGWSNLIAEDRGDRQAALMSPERLTTPGQDLLASIAYGAPIASADASAPEQQRRTAFWSAVDYRPDPRTVPAASAAQGDAESIGVMMTLAALRTLNVSQTRPDLVEHMLSLPTAKDCLDFSLLHMKQCVSAAHFKYEDAFCIAEHQLKDMGECLGETVNSSVAVRPAPPALGTAMEASVAPEAPAEAETVAN